MKSDYINPFVESASILFNEMCGFNIKRGNLSIKKEGFVISGVAVVFGITGSIHGRVMYDMSIETALKISSLLNCSEITIFDELAKDTIGEIGNIITGKTITLLSSKGYNVDITPPSIVTGNNVNISNISRDKMVILVVPLITEAGIIEINLSLKELIAEEKNV